MSRFLSVCLNPTFQRTIVLEKLQHGEVNRASKARLDASGKGVNVCRILQQLGAEAKQLTHLGPGKEEFLSLCRADNLKIIHIESDSPIRSCITLLDGDKKSTTEIIEPTQKVGNDTVKGIRRAFSEELKRTDYVILSGSKAPGYPDDLFAEFCREARNEGIPVLADYRGDELLKSLPFQPSLVKINLVEFAATFLPNLKVSEADDSSALDEVIKKLQDISLNGTDFVLTRGARDILMAENGRVETFSPPKIVPVNTIGSGDSVSAGIAFALSGGASLKDAVSEGARCGAENAKRLKPGSLF